MKCTNFFVAILVMFLLASSSADIGSSSNQLTEDGPSLSPNVDFNEILDEIDYSAIEEHVRFFASIGSRISGYPGCDEAADYISRSLSSYGLDVSDLIFNVTVPFDYGASLEIVDRPESFAIYPMEPNLASPVVADGLVGPLVYVGKGDWDELEGKVVEGAVLLMDYESGMNWFKAARLGAKAVIFIEPVDFPTIFENQNKHLYAFPFNFPRFYMKETDFLELYSLMLSAEPDLLYANISSKVVWERREARNVFATIEGDAHRDQVMIISSHYDSYSAALSVAPGANDAGGIATLLEIARLLSQQELKPLYSVMFVAYAGHHQILEGARQFYRSFLSPTNVERLDVKLQIDIKISTLTNKLATGYGGRFITKLGGPEGVPILDEIDDYITTDLVAEVNRQTRKDYNIIRAGGAAGDSATMALWFESYYKMNDAEVLCLNYGPGHAMITVDNSDYEYSPVDTFERLNRDNLRKNAERAACTVYGLTQTNNLPTFTPRRHSQSFGGITGEYNPTTDFYDAVPNAIVFAWYPGWPRPIATLSGEDGSYAFYEIPLVGTRAYGTPVWTRRTAFVIDPDTGNIEYAPDKGPHVWATEAFEEPDIAWADTGFFALFKCGTLVLFDNLHPDSLREILAPKIINLYTEVEPEHYGYHIIAENYHPYSHSGTFERFNDFSFSLATLYVPPDEDITVLLTHPHETTPVAILANTSDDRPRGNGYNLAAGQQVVITNTALQCAVDVLRASKVYVDSLEASSLPTDTIIRGRTMAQELIDNAIQALSDNRYVESYSYQLKAWAAARAPYIESRSNYVDIISVVPYFSLMLIPFVFVVERLVFQLAGGKKRLLVTLAIFIAIDAVLSYMHPGFALASNPILVVIAFFIIILIAPSMYMVLNYVAGSLKRLRMKVIGRHFVDVSRGSTVVLAFQTGTENMRKRRLRTSLMLLTIILVVIGVVMFSSLEGLTLIRIDERERVPLYNGVLAQIFGAATLNVDSIDMGTAAYDFLLGSYKDKAEVLPDVWMYASRYRYAKVGDVAFNFEHGEYRYKVYVLQGMSSYKPDWAEVVLTAGRWFTPGEVYACILPDVVAEALNATEGDRVSVLGRSLMVVGIADSDGLEAIVDLDGEIITPYDYREPDNPPAEADAVVMVTLDFIFKYNPRIASISIIPENASQVREFGAEIFTTLRDYNTIGGLEDRVILYGMTTTITAFGWQMQMIPLVIAAMMIFNLILGSVKERERDIFIYSAVGLSPFHVAFMFLAETMIYGIIGGLLGYVSAMTFARVLPFLGAYAISLNYSSSFATSSMGMIILVTILSSIYPVIKASKIVTPSLERAWKIPTKPVGNAWEIPLPVVVFDKEDQLALTKYLTEYIRSQKGEVGVFSPEEEVKLSEAEELVQLEVQTRLAPYEQGVMQNFKARFTYDKERKIVANMLLERTSGEYDLWLRLVRGFADEFRKQFLIWRTLPDDEKARYKKGEEVS